MLKLSINIHSPVDSRSLLQSRDSERRTGLERTFDKLTDTSAYTSSRSKNQTAHHGRLQSHDEALAAQEKAEQR